MQTAADSAAMAGAGELNYGDVSAGGKADAASNGYTDGTGSVSGGDEQSAEQRTERCELGVCRSDRHQA